MNEWRIFFELGWNHILSIEALDHLLFLMCMGSVYALSNRKKAILEVSVFAIGHTISLAVNSSNILPANQNWIEFLIPMTIVFMAFSTFRHAEQDNNSNIFRWISFLTFGLIHGLGFAGTFRFLVSDDDHLFASLFSFTIGLELAQFLVILAMTLLGLGWIKGIKFQEKYWIRLISTFCFFIGLYLCIQRFPVIF